MGNKIGGPGNPNPSPETRFQDGNVGGKAGRKHVYSQKRSALAASAVGLPDDERPLTFFLKMMKGEPFQFRIRVPGKDRENPRERVALRWYYPTVEDMKWGASMAAPYMHPKLAQIEHTGNVNHVHEDFLKKLDKEDNGGTTTRH